MNQDLNIYVASLSDYNAGRLVGVWIDCEGKDEEDIQLEIKAMLATSREPNAEEYAIHDHEGFQGFDVGEYTPISEIALMVELIEEHGDGARAAASNVGSAEDVADEMERYHGDYDDLEEWAEQMCDDLGYLENVPDFVKYHIDYKSMARDLLMSDFYSVELDGSHHIFSH